MWQKLKFIMDRVKNLHSLKEDITGSYHGTQCFVQSVKHMG